MRIRSVISHSAQAVLEGALISLLVVGLIAGSAFAAKGGSAACHGKRCSSGGSGTAALVVSPNPVPAYSAFQIAGCGYTPSVGIKFVQYASDATGVFGGMTDSAGCLVNAVGWANAPGTVRLEAWENSVTLAASTSFTIQ